MTSTATTPATPATTARPGRVNVAPQPARRPAVHAGSRLASVRIDDQLELAPKVTIRAQEYWRGNMAELELRSVRRAEELAHAILEAVAAWRAQPGAPVDDLPDPPTAAPTPPALPAGEPA